MDISQEQINRYLIDAQKKYDCSNDQKENLLQACYDSARNFCERTLGLDRLEVLDKPSKGSGMVLSGCFPANVDKIRCFVTDPEKGKPYCYLVANFENRDGNVFSYGIVRIRKHNGKKFSESYFLKECERFYKSGIKQAVEMALIKAELRGYKRARKKILDKNFVFK